MSSTISTQSRFLPLSSGNAELARGIDWSAIILLSAHAILGVLVSRYTLLSTVHALLTISIGLFLAVRSGAHPERVAYAAAYIVGAEVLWRMTGAQVFWEVGKYSCAAVFLLFMLFHARKVPISPVLYFALLLPSIALTVTVLGSFSSMRESLSFYLSGPLALAAAWAFFSQAKLSMAQLQRLFLALLCPTVSVAAIALFGTLTQARLHFTTESNFATSGGFGPNQVAGILSLGVVVSLLWLLTNKGGWVNKAAIFAVLAFLATQAALTFSRGGLYNAVGASVVGLYFLLRDRRSRARVIMAVGAILLVAVFVVFPRLEQFTGGAISTRFKDVDLTHRDEIVRSDLLLWTEHPILGVGPGVAQVHRRMPHTEITRLLAEHGLFGLLAIGVLTVSAIQAIRRTPRSSGKALSGSMIAFSLLFMLDKAMRLAVPSFAFGLAFVTLIPDGAGERLKREVMMVIAQHRINAQRRLAALKIHSRAPSDPLTDAAAKLG